MYLGCGWGEPQCWGEWWNVAGGMDAGMSSMDMAKGRDPGKNGGMDVAGAGMLG